MSIPRRAALASAVLALTAPALVLAGCGNDTPAAPREPSVWVADDSEEQDGRPYVTCEDQHDREISVWVTGEQVDTRKGAPCPDGELRSVDDDVEGLSAGKTFTAKPTVPSARTTTARSTRDTAATTSTTRATRATRTTRATTTAKTTTAARPTTTRRTS